MVHRQSRCAHCRSIVACEKQWRTVSGKQTILPQQRSQHFLQSDARLDQQLNFGSGHAVVHRRMVQLGHHIALDSNSILLSRWPWIFAQQNGREASLSCVLAIHCMQASLEETVVKFDRLNARLVEAMRSRVAAKLASNALLRIQQDVVLGRRRLWYAKASEHFMEVLLKIFYL